jgi:HK97 family phage portal protein
MASLIERILQPLGYAKKSTDDLTFDQLFDKVYPLNSGSLKFSNQREQLRAYLDWVYAASKVIAQDAALIDLQAFANRTGTKSQKVARRLELHPSLLRELQKTKAANGKPKLEELDSHILLDLMEKPNPVQSGITFQEMTFLHMLLAGEAFWGIVRNGVGLPVQLWPMFPYGMKHVTDTDGSIKGWIYRVGGEDVPWLAEDVVHIPLTDPNSIYRGMSVVRASARAIETDANSADWTRAFFRNSARPDVVLETDAKLDDNVFDRLKEQWDDEHRGANQAHKTALLEQGLKAKVLTVTQKDMEYLEGRKFNRDQILAMFVMSRTILGIVEGDGRSNMETAEYNHTKRAVKPLMSKEVSAINSKLAPAYDQKLVIGYVDPVPEDKQFLHKQRTESINKYRTINEVRAELGDEPLPGGDVLYVDANLVPLGTEKLDPADPTDTPEEKPEDPADDAPDSSKSLGGKKKRLIATT